MYKRQVHGLVHFRIRIALSIVFYVLRKFKLVGESEGNVRHFDRELVKALPSTKMSSLNRR